MKGNQRIILITEGVIRRLEEYLVSEKKMSEREYLEARIKELKEYVEKLKS
jgi:C4-type Zn-finger protein